MLEMGGDEVTMGDVRREFPRWHLWQGLAGSFYARLPRTSPPVVVRGESWADVRDQIREHEKGRFP